MVAWMGRDEEGERGRDEWLENRMLIHVSKNANKRKAGSMIYRYTYAYTHVCYPCNRPWRTIEL
jgi:hypothetical protein